MKLDVSSLAHTKWECKYHIVFAPKYRRQVIYGKIKQDIGQMLRKLCEYKGRRAPDPRHDGTVSHRLDAVRHKGLYVSCRYDAGSK